MSRSLNKVQLIGNLGKDPDVRSTTGGNRVAEFSLATTRSWRSASGEQQEKTEWHRCIAWNSKSGAGLADVVEKNCTKGKQLFVEGRIEYRQWQDKEGQTRYTTEINVTEIILLGGGAGRGEGGGESSAPRERSAKPAKAAAAGKPGGEEFEDFPGALQEEDDDLPF